MALEDQLTAARLLRNIDLNESFYRNGLHNSSTEIINVRTYLRKASMY